MLERTHEISKLTDEFREVTRDEIASGNVETQEDVERFVDESTDVYFEKVQMGRYDKMEIFTDLRGGTSLKAYKAREGDTLQDLVDRMIRDQLHHVLRYIANETFHLSDVTESGDVV